MKKRKPALTGAMILAVSVASTAGSVSAAEDAKKAEETEIVLSDEEILVDGEVLSEDDSAAVYGGADIVYYKVGQGETYGEGDDSDGHSEEEAAENTVITITEPGTYRVSGSISAGQISVDLGEESLEDETAVVNLILDGADITCSVAPAIVVYHAYECGDDDTETATVDIDTSAAGFNLILADGSENTVNGSHVAKIYKEGTTQEEIDSGEAKKQWKFDAAIDSLVSFNINSETQGDGKLIVNGDNEGISSALHMTINGGEIVISSADDSINTSEDGVSVLVINDGIITCNAGAGKEGDGIDSNGWIVQNGGCVTACANPDSQDSGIDSDLGIYINGGTLLAGGNMYDEVSEESGQSFLVLGFAEPVSAGQLLLLKNENGEAVTAFSLENDGTILVFSSDLLTDGTYTLYKVSSVTGDPDGNIYTNITDWEDEVQLQYSSGDIMGPGGGFGGQKPADGERPELSEDGEAMGNDKRPEEPGSGDVMELPEKGERPELPENSERPELPESGENMEFPANGGPQGIAENGEQPETSFELSGKRNVFSRITEVQAEKLS